MAYQGIILVLLAVLIVSCTGTDDGMESMTSEVETDVQNFTFSDGFEGIGGNFDALFPQDSSRWSGVQIVSPSNGQNRMTLVDTPVFQGDYALSIAAAGSDATLSKVDLEKGGLRMLEGQTVRIGANFFIEGESTIESLLLIDVECCSCWDPQVPNNQCPGVRLMMSGTNDYLSIERGKLGLETLTQNEVAFPRNEWVKVEWIMQLSSNENGSNQLFINGNLVIDVDGGNMPNPSIFRELFAEEDIDFNLQTPVEYERFQIGVTANPTTSDVQLYLDDFFIEITPD